MSLEIKQKTTYIVNMPEGENWYWRGAQAELSADQLGEEIKRAKKEIALLQRFVDSAVSMLGGYKQEYVKPSKPKYEVSEEAIRKVYNAITCPMFVTDIKIVAKLSEFTVYRALYILIDRKLVKKYRSAENKKAMCYDRCALPSVAGKAGGVETVAIQTEESKEAFKLGKSTEKDFLQLMRDH